MINIDYFFEKIRKKPPVDMYNEIEYSQFFDTITEAYYLLLIEKVKQPLSYKFTPFKGSRDLYYVEYEGRYRPASYIENELIKSNLYATHKNLVMSHLLLEKE